MTLRPIFLLFFRPVFSQPLCFLSLTELFQICPLLYMYSGRCFFPFSFCLLFPFKVTAAIFALGDSHFFAAPPSCGLSCNLISLSFTEYRDFQATGARTSTSPRTVHMQSVVSEFRLVVTSSFLFLPLSDQVFSTTDP